ncbi:MULTISPECIES: L,D-transpeptidase [Ciceribacter]|uniref:Lipoprotein-anchoring transpeptidase ErfK/SrfK n=1 Tax=Ciceribacter lividus TaxID=1197950 RepID=A0A6I7HR47_9HYPH|nr:MULTISPECIES: L,D-transpeptidase [Ciceribacter]MCO6177211.1 L,D-transpeptidase [Ciceribacter sp. RN22]RCW27390.1 lipoprotein-anchoring transpeptidase ErfK/SrfK [Ciceribacter lividus]
MIKKTLLLATSLILPLAPAAEANDRYGNRPPVVVSPDLTAPWVMQLGGAVRPVVYAPRPQPVAPAPRRQIRRSFDQPAAVAPQPVAVRPNNPAPKEFNPIYLPQMVDYQTAEPAGTIVIDTNNRFLYLVLGDGKARRYGVGVGKPGFEWAGKHKVTRKAEWPAWNPPQEMITREAAKGHFIPAHMEGGPANPLGARAMYLGSTLYRIHGTNAPWTIGNAVSSGCIRMRNEDVVDLYERVNVGTTVIVI